MSELTRLPGNIIVRMFAFDNRQHNLPHIHMSDGCNAEFTLTGKLINGKLPKSDVAIVTDYIDRRNSELNVAWSKMVRGENCGKIEP